MVICLLPTRSGTIRAGSISFVVIYLCPLQRQLENESAGVTSLHSRSMIVGYRRPLTWLLPTIPSDRSPLSSGVQLRNGDIYGRCYIGSMSFLRSHTVRTGVVGRGWSKKYLSKYSMDFYPLFISSSLSDVILKHKMSARLHNICMDFPQFKVPNEASMGNAILRKPITVRHVFFSYMFLTFSYFEICLNMYYLFVMITVVNSY